MRRSDREISDVKSILEIMDRCPVLHLAFGGDTPYIVPVNYVHTLVDGKIRLYFHSAREGRKVDFLKSGVSVAFEMERMIDLVSSRPGSWTTSFESVVGLADARRVEDETRQREVLNLLLTRCGFSGGQDFNGCLPKTDIWELTVRKISAKANYLR